MTKLTQQQLNKLTQQLLRVKDVTKLNPAQLLLLEQLGGRYLKEGELFFEMSSYKYLTLEINKVKFVISKTRDNKPTLFVYGASNRDIKITTYNKSKIDFYNFIQVATNEKRMGYDSSIYYASARKKVLINWWNDLKNGSKKMADLREEIKERKHQEYINREYDEIREVQYKFKDASINEILELIKSKLSYGYEFSIDAFLTFSNKFKNDDNESLEKLRWNRITSKLISLNKEGKL